MFARSLFLLVLVTGCRATAPAVDPGRGEPTSTPVGGGDERLGVQLYSVRRELEVDLPGTLARLSQMGFRNVETHNFFGRSAAEFRALLESHGLAARSMHVRFEDLEADPAPAIADAKALGAEFIVCPWIPHGDAFDAEDHARAMALFLRVGHLAKAAGLRFAYHVHGYELHPGGLGETFFDQMIQQSPPGVVDFELDVYYVALGGGDPLAYLERYPGRFPLIHLKDMKKGTQTGTRKGKTEVTNSVTLGTGTIDFPTVIPAALAQGSRWLLLEDENPAALTQLPQSLAYLRGLPR
jgi:sugar phosphate isomerase/epimerase